MTSPPALQEDQYYHIYNRGKNRENLFIEERNYRYFLRLYEKYITPLADPIAYCLLRNHFHFLVRIKGNDCQSGEDCGSYRHMRRTGKCDAR